MLKQCDSAAGERARGKMRPLHFDEIVKLLQQTGEMQHILVYADHFPQEKIFDIRGYTAQLLVENLVLPEEAFVAIRKTAELIGAIKDFFTQHAESYPALTALLQKTEKRPEIIRAIKKIIDEDGQVKPDASAELTRLRKAQDKAINALDKAFRNALSAYAKSGFLADVAESMRNGRRVLGIASEYKRQVPGIIHDESDSGRTVFIEPEAVVNLQNEIFEIEREEKREIYRILLQLTAHIAPFVADLNAYQLTLGILDFTRAKAKYALQIHAQVPHCEKKPVIHLVEARHPVLIGLHARSHKKVVPLNVTLDSDTRMLLISGPNAGGKSVAMKTMGLLVYMVHCGLPIPADAQSRIGMFEQLFCDIGDTQSMEDELSTYSARLMKMKYFLEHADAQTLMLIDEFGSGTDPAMGGAIAEAALESLHTKKIFGVITTHYANLKACAADTAGMENGSMVFDEKELQPLYILETGKPGSSYAFELAKKTQLPNALIEEAKKRMDKEHVRFEALLKEVRIEKEHIRLRMKEAGRTEETLKKKTAELDKAFDKAREKQERYNLKKLEQEEKAVREMEQQFREILKELKESGQIGTDEQTLEPIKEKARQFLQQKKKKVHNDQLHMHKRKFPVLQPAEIKVGGFVRMHGGTETGTIESIKKDKAVVVFNNMRTTVSLSELVGVAEEDKPRITGNPVKVQMEETVFPTELDLRGKPKEEAMLELEKYLDQATLRKVFQVRILHGKGTGALRDLVQNVLKAYPGIKKYAYAVREDGGDGVTVVEM
ncbi:MAG: Smr/MutS family protein [Chitinophagales bacterium]